MVTILETKMVTVSVELQKELLSTMFDSRRDPQVRAGKKIFIVLQLRIGVDLFKLKLEIKLHL